MPCVRLSSWASLCSKVNNKITILTNAFCLQATTELAEVPEECDLEYNCYWGHCDYEEGIMDKVKTIFCASYCVTSTKTWCLNDTIALDRLYGKWGEVSVDGEDYEGIVAAPSENNEEWKRPAEMIVQHLVDGQVTHIFVNDGWDKFCEVLPHGYLRSLAWMKGGTRLGRLSVVSLLSEDLRGMVGRLIPKFWKYE